MDSIFYTPPYLSGTRTKLNNTADDLKAPVVPEENNGSQEASSSDSNLVESTNSGIIGQSNAEDFLQKIKLLESAAEQGNVKGMLLLGFMYYGGHGVQKDVSKALTYFKQAAAKGEKEAKKMLFCLYGWQGAIRVDPSDSDFKKNQPYRKIKMDVCPAQLNGKAQFSSQSAIVCRHLVAQYIEDASKGEINWAFYSTEEAITGHISSKEKAEDIYRTWKKKAKCWDLIQNENVGHYLKAHFEDMQGFEAKEKNRVLLVESVGHVMVIRLSINETGDKPVYKVRFYDPNLTNDEVHCETSDLSMLSDHTLEHYVNGKIVTQDGSIYESYYKGEAAISLIRECDLASSNNYPAKNPKKSLYPDPFQLTQTHLFLLLRENLLTPEWAKLFGQLQEKKEYPREKLFALFAAKNAKGSSGLFMALRKGQTAAVKASANLLGTLLPLQSDDEQDKLVAIIAAEDEYGNPGLTFAISSGYEDTVNAYGELLSLLSENNGKGKLVELLKTKGVKQGEGGIPLGLEGETEDFILRYEVLLHELPALVSGQSK